MSREAIRQQRETFEQLKKQDRHWFALRLVIGYSSVALLLAVLGCCVAILLNSAAYPEFAVKSASATLFAVMGLLVAVWKFAFNPKLQTTLHPVTDLKERRTTRG